MEEARAKLEAAKARKFRELARHAQAHAPYYANIIRERGIDLETCMPADFPLLRADAPVRKRHRRQGFHQPAHHQ